MLAIGLVLAVVPVLVMADKDNAEKVATDGRQPFAEAGSQGPGAVDASGSGVQRPKWDFSKAPRFDEASKNLGRETGIDKVEARANVEAPVKPDDGKHWSWGSAVKDGLIGGAVGAGMGWLLASVGVIAAPVGIAVLVGAGIGLLGGFLGGGLSGLF